MRNVIEILPLISGDHADGPSYSVLRLCELLITQNIHIELVNCDCTDIKSPPLFLKRFPLSFGPKKLCCSTAMYNYLTRMALNNQISLIHSHGLWTMPNIYSWWIGRKFNLPVIISPRGSLAKWAMSSGSIVKKFFWPIYQRPALVAAQCFHATAINEYTDIRRLGFKQPVAVIPNGIDIPDYHKNTSLQKRTLLFLGRINPIKGLDMLLPAWKNIQDKFPQWHLQIVGPDSRGYLQNIQELAKKLGLQRIEFSGLLTGDAKLKAYQNADLFILPSYTENFGMSIAEALAAGTPVITTKGTPWQSLEQHQAGWWIDLNIDALTKCMELALNLAPEKLSAMGLAGRELMIKEYSWEHIGQMMQITYEWIINNGTPPLWVHLD